MIGSHDRLFNEFNVDYIETLGKDIKILDNKNLKGDTIGRRRLRIQENEKYHFRQILFILPELIEYTRKRGSKFAKFIDTAGVIYNYKKEKFSKLYCKKIKKVDTFKNYVVISCYETQQTFKVPYNFWNNIKEPQYLQLLQIKGTYIVYDILEEIDNSKRRKI